MKPAGFFWAAPFAILCLAVWLLGTAPSALAQAEDGKDAGPYTLRPGDVIRVFVLEDAELETQTLVLPDGRISMPIAGTVVAAGKTPTALAALLRRRLRSKFAEPPNVTVFVTQLAEQKKEEKDEPVLFEVFVVGEVARPGRYEYDSETPITVIKALSLAGGPGPFAARTRIQVREAIETTLDDDKNAKNAEDSKGPAAVSERVRFFNYDTLEVTGAGAKSIDLRPLVDGAVIVVPERGLFE